MPAAAAISLRTPLPQVRGIGPRTAERLRELGLRNVGQLIAHLPFKHERLEAEAPIAGLVPGRIVSARGTITATRVVRGRTPRFLVALVDDSGRIDLVFFNQTYLLTKLHPGMRVRVQGKAAQRLGGLQMANPKVEVLPETRDEPTAADARLRPVYPASEQIHAGEVGKAVASVLDAALPLIEDHLPAGFRHERSLPELREAYRMMHAPCDEEEASAARRRLAYDELLLLQLAVALKRAERRGGGKAAPLKWTAAIDRRIRARLPFALTPAQDAVVREIAGAISTDVPANRLLQGDVGSGKTVVALYAMLMAVASGHQAALLAPTELLAEQHHESMSALLRGSRVKMALLTGTLGAAARRDLLARLRAREIDLVVGTHALLTGGVEFGSLALAVVDEQHRFGVHQRARLRSKGARGELPHMLVMTATPIPRTLAMTLLGDLEVSTIHGLPPGRKPVRTRVVGPEKAPEVYAWVRARLDAGEQAFVVAPTIDPSEEGGGAGALASVRELKERLERGPLAGKRLAELHGQLDAPTRATVMDRLRRGELDAIIATTVIEVGVDIPGATIMVVEHAERFGLAQLHQLRGRVGRSHKPGACVLISSPTTPEAAARLAIMAETTDGFRLAERDLEIRGIGDLVGVRQSGMPPFKVADIPRDLELLTMARRDAAAWIERSPGLGRPEESILRRRMMKSHGRWLDLAGVA